GQLIQTGGSIYLNTTDNATNKSVALKNQKSIGIDFTDGKGDQDMEIFVKDMSSAKMNWVPQKNETSTSSWKMTETTMDAQGNVISQNSYNTEEEWKKHLKEEEDKKLKAERERVKQELAAEKERVKQAAEQKKNAKNIGKINETMSKHMQTQNLGYINCDKFYNEPTTSIYIATNSKVFTEYYLIYIDVRGVMNGVLAGNKVEFNNIAKNRQATLVAVSFADKKAYFYKTSVNPTSANNIQIALQEVTEAYVDQQLALIK
ncbi:MAG: hypothetical protein HYZ42_12010, partial [Bacteroidetes bacterium]|nr:hypothetical protein [Bacteroidota bacterium]